MLLQDQVFTWSSFTMRSMIQTIKCSYFIKPQFSRELPSIFIMKFTCFISKKTFRK